MAYRCHNTSNKQKEEEEEEKQKKKTKTFCGKCQYRCAADLIIVQYAVKIGTTAHCWASVALGVCRGRPVSQGCERLGEHMADFKASKHSHKIDFGFNCVQQYLIGISI